MILANVVTTYLKNSSISAPDNIKSTSLEKKKKKGEKIREKKREDKRNKEKDERKRKKKRGRV